MTTAEADLQLRLIGFVDGAFSQTTVYSSLFSCASSRSSGSVPLVVQETTIVKHGKYTGIMEPPSGIAVPSHQ